MKTYLFIFCGSLLLSIGITPAVIFIARALNVYDDIHARKVHAGVIPRIGGLAIFTAAMALIVPVLLLQNTIGQTFRNAGPQVIALLVSASWMFAVGLIDDLVHLRARTKFTAQFLAAAAVCWFGVRIESIQIGEWASVHLGVFGCPLTVLWIMGVTNAMNFIDGLDGLAGGIAMIACGVIATLAVYTGQVMMAVLMLAMCGSLLGFLLFNFNPARVFMGDGGSLFLGFMLGAGSVLCAGKSTMLVGLALPFLALGVPIFDTLFSMMRRILERRSMFSPDRGHIHHRLLELGLTHRHVVLIIYGVTLVSTGLGMFMMVTRRANTLIIFLLISLLLMLFFRVVGAVRLRESFARLQENVRIQRRKSRDKRDFENSILLVRNARDFSGWWHAICCAAGEMKFACLAIKLQRRDGTDHTLIWRNPAFQPEKDLANLVEIHLPVRQRREGQPLRLEVLAPVQDKLELAGYRAKLLARLIDEHPISSLKDEGDGKPGRRMVGKEDGKTVGK